MSWLTDPQAWIAFTTLLALEIVLGIDNVVFISILAGKLPTDQQRSARIVGLGLAVLMRIVLLFSLSWIIRLTASLFVAFGQEISGRDLIVIVGGLFLLAGMVDDIGIMISAVIVAVGFMMVFAGPISRFVERHPTVKMLALSFLLLIGVTLIADGFDQHIPRGYLYFAMAFSVFVEMLNLKVRKPKAAPVTLREPYTKPE